MGIGLLLRVEECEGIRHVQMLLLFRIADNDMATNIFTQHFLVHISVLNAIMLPLKEDLWRAFSLKEQTSSLGGLPY